MPKTKLIDGIEIENQGSIYFDNGDLYIVRNNPIPMKHKLDKPSILAIANALETIVASGAFESFSLVFDDFKVSGQAHANLNFDLSFTDQKQVKPKTFKFLMLENYELIKIAKLFKGYAKKIS